MHILDERPQDAAAIAAITTAAFQGASHASGSEAAVVDALRRTGRLTMSLIKLWDGEIVGHVAFSPVCIVGEGESHAVDWYALGPVSVRPDRQRQGVGTALIRDGLDRLELSGAEGCVLLGDPDYYSRFGFRSSDRLTYLGFATPYLQCLTFGRQPPQGAVIFDPAFDTE